MIPVGLMHKDGTAGALEGVPTWVWVLGALHKLELEDADAAGFGTPAVLRAGLDVSQNRSTVDLNHVRRTLERLEEELCVERERTDDGLVLWRLRELGRTRLAVLVQVLEQLRALVVLPASRGAP